MMVLFSVLLVILAVVGVMSISVEDFSNNLVTDLGPLLALFGDTMTTQYLSESTTIPDYIIFAVAPIGILTAVFSVIRVCGSPRFKAFIGHAQEASGAVEAELCTSTSHDVCEMFSGGGITRVLQGGRPQLLELVRLSQKRHHELDIGPTPGIIPYDKTKDEANHEPKDSTIVSTGNLSASQQPAFASTNQTHGLTRKSVNSISNLDEDSTMGIYLFRQQLQELISQGVWAVKWRRGKSTMFEPKRQGEDVTLLNPNLSLNVGILKPPLRYFILVATLGIVAQVGVVVFAGLSPYYLPPPANGIDPTTASVLYPPIMFIAGTTLMCVGMACCAALIGNTTEERYYEPGPVAGQDHDHESHPGMSKTNLIWLQAGDQVVGGQTFRPFAFFEGKPKEYITSRKAPQDNRSRQLMFIGTYFAVFATMAGYIAQFIGLRGLSSIVTVTQLALTIIMSVIRGGLKIQRLGEDKNAMRDVNAAVVGHELDWLSFKLFSDGDDEASAPWFHANGYHKHGILLSPPEHNRSKSAKAQPSSTGLPSSSDGKREPGGAGHSSEQAASSSRISNLEELVRIRVRLAHLTGHHAFKGLEKLTFQMWPDDQIAVRAKARKLARALNLAAAELFVGGKIKTDVHLRIGVGNYRQPVAYSDMSWVPLTLRWPGDLTPKGWRIDSARLEAILGLWLWSMISERSEAVLPSRARPLLEETPKARIVAAGLVGKSSKLHEYIQGEINLWVPGTLKLSRTILDSKSSEYGLISLWKGQNPEGGIDGTERMIGYLGTPEDDQNIPRYTSWSPLISDPEEEMVRVRYLDLLASQGRSGLRYATSLKLMGIPLYCCLPR
jgi:hypothetical protein